MIFVVLFTVPVIASTSSEETAQWPSLRGPNDNGLVLEGNPPVEWSEQKNIRWKTAIPGAGHATPILWGDFLYVQSAVEIAAEGVPPSTKHQYKLFAVNRNSGKVAWEKTVREGPPAESRHHQTSTFASNSGITDGEHLYAYFGSQGLYCFDFKGNLKWQKDFGDMRTRNSFGEGSSPAIEGDLIVVNWDHEDDSFIVALNKRTGKELWRTERSEVSSWATPLIVEHAERHQVIVPASGKSRSYDLKTGKSIWECAGLGSNVIPMALHQDGVVYVTSGHRSPAMQAILLDEAKGDITGTDAVLWSIDQNTPYVSSPVLYGDRLFMTKNRNAILSSYNSKSGEMIFGPERLVGMGHVYASLVGVKDRFYISDLDGTTLVVKNATEFGVLARNVLDEGAAASPIIAGDVLYLRGYNHIYCIGEN
jgi:outer membrane protein assembly factor BamB